MKEYLLSVINSIHNNSGNSPVDTCDPSLFFMLYLFACRIRLQSPPLSHFLFYCSGLGLLWTKPLDKDVMLLSTQGSV